VGETGFGGTKGAGEGEIGGRKQSRWQPSATFSEIAIPSRQAVQFAKPINGESMA